MLRLGHDNARLSWGRLGKREHLGLFILHIGVVAFINRLRCLFIFFECSDQVFGREVLLDYAVHFLKRDLHVLNVALTHVVLGVMLHLRHINRVIMLEGIGFLLDHEPSSLLHQLAMAGLPFFIYFSCS